MVYRNPRRDVTKREGAAGRDFIFALAPTEARPFFREGLPDRFLHIERFYRRGDGRFRRGDAVGATDQPNSGPGTPSFPGYYRIHRR